jgi:hypothetical protein
MSSAEVRSLILSIFIASPDSTLLGHRSGSARLFSASWGFGLFGAAGSRRKAFVPFVDTICGLRRIGVRNAGRWLKDLKRSGFE